ncbi:MAG TPA: NAD+ synthase [Ramlibacter sp.]|jgi:NAD+ synthase (glutamine-hydrolysing)|uniref:NAD+ synthase n=1 Tax=Ramlibacter sp. TaxID=1917967 RepID=UPI002D61155B|nr:NAD+ synthase [Ramlibacter sp.]HZY20743.1 NAD+ synthase [Ramlibacter sp.]
MLRIQIAQINPTVGDLVGNVRLMTDAARAARTQDAQMVVFPELALTGYYPGDLLDDPSFLRRVDEAFGELLLASRQISSVHWVIGMPVAKAGPGKPLHNALRVVCGGEVLLEYAKQLLPTYNVFDERRHFEPGPDTARVLPVAGARVGFLICEDGWAGEGTEYALNPFDRLRDAAPDLVVSIHASPSNVGKREQRHHVFAAAALRTRLPILYVNQVGGHDQLVYDGGSFAVEADGRVVWEAARFSTHLEAIDFETGRFLRRGDLPSPVPVEGLPTLAFYREQIVLGIRDYARRCGFEKAAVGCSGGIDSALTLALAAEALGPQNVLAITMPSRFSSPGSVSDSQQLCRNLGIELLEHPIGAIVSSFESAYAQSSGAALQGIALENLQARVRGTVLMEISNSLGHLVLTTGNKSEISVGYCTLYGDTNGGLGPLGDLYKVEVFALARHLNEAAGRDLIPAAIIDKPPSAELAPNQQDTDSLPPYELLDQVLKLHIEGSRLADWEAETARRCVDGLLSTPEGAALVQRIHRMVARNEYKRRQSPPIIRVRCRAFGSGRQLPIAAVYP